LISGDDQNWFWVTTKNDFGWKRKMISVETKKQIGVKTKYVLWWKQNMICVENEKSFLLKTTIVLRWQRETNFGENQKKYPVENHHHDQFITKNDFLARTENNKSCMPLFLQYFHNPLEKPFYLRNSDSLQSNIFIRPFQSPNFNCTNIAYENLYW